LSKKKSSAISFSVSLPSHSLGLSTVQVEDVWRWWRATGRRMAPGGGGGSNRVDGQGRRLLLLVCGLLFSNSLHGRPWILGGHRVSSHAPSLGVRAHGFPCPANSPAGNVDDRACALDPEEYRGNCAICPQHVCHHFFALTSSVDVVSREETISCFHPFSLR
jgi:hypothetical protein